MKEKWKVIERLLSEEYDIEVQGSYEGWGAGYDPKFLPLTEMWVNLMPYGVYCILFRFL